MARKSTPLVKAVEIALCLLLLVEGALLAFHFLGKEYFVVAMRPPEGPAAFYHGNVDNSYYQGMGVYAYGGDFTRIGKMQWGVFLLWIPNRPPAPAAFLLVVADWVLIVPLFLGMLFFRWRLGRTTTLAQNTCPNCNYDLRAHKPGQKCPECGTEIPRLGWRSPKHDP